jgi:hypothetical protein
MIPAGPPSFFFGEDHRRKCLYSGGRLLDPWSRGVIRSWDVADWHIEPAEYRVRLHLKRGGDVIIECDERGVAIIEDGHRAMVTQSALRLPRFDGHPRGALLRVLYHDLLVNIVDGRPVANLLALPRPSLRHAAMMAMALRETGNLDLIAPWILSLRDPFEGAPTSAASSPGPSGSPDAIGQALYLASLVGGRSHPLADAALRAIPRFRHGHCICGITDGAQHPVYQTKWLKFGLRALGLDDPYVIPRTYDSYSSIFWMDFRDQHVAGRPLTARQRRLHPHLHWAEAHFHGWAPPVIPEPGTYPITWDARDPAGDFASMSVLGSSYVRRQIAAPHGGHAAEMLLYLLHHGNGAPSGNSTC